jgi:pyruvate/2-oxoglutarate dehydrogenase complex dihydrolipoamide acyltransferase (E2) component
MGTAMTVATVVRWCAAPGAEVAPGSKLLEIKVDLSAGAQQDCPPVSYYRLVARERAWLRKLEAAVGEDRAVGAVMAILSTEKEESLDGAPARPLRAASVGILHDPVFGA